MLLTLLVPEEFYELGARAMSKIWTSWTTEQNPFADASTELNMTTKRDCVFVTKFTFIHKFKPVPFMLVVPSLSRGKKKTKQKTKNRQLTAYLLHKNIIRRKKKKREKGGIKPTMFKVFLISHVKMKKSNSSQFKNFDSI